MKNITIPSCAALGLLFGGMVSGHDLGGDPDPHYDRSVAPPEAVAPGWFLARTDTGRDRPQNNDTPASSSDRPAQAAPFDAFAPRVKVRWDDRFLYVESDGIPLHGMMVGITAWQQQVPLPQRYFGDNAWRFPLVPVPAVEPQTIRGHFLRGAIAIAANGVPIFNPQNNRGEVSAEIGELDEWGGHCGRADDYHYHAAPLHLQDVVGKGQPIAFALDGYPIYGLTEPDGSQPEGLDAFDGHTTPQLGYHYHASKKYPYVNGGFHGEVVERDGQVDPQPRAQPVRPSLPPLRGAKITAFTAAPDDRSFSLRYAVDGKPAQLDYAASADGGWRFQFVDAGGTKRDEMYRADGRGGGGGMSDHRPPTGTAIWKESIAASSQPKKRGALVLHSPEVADGGMLPADYTGDGTGSTPPLEWGGAPDGTKSYVLIMHHIDPEGKTKWYWTLYNIPGNVRGLPKNVKDIGTSGNNSINGRIGYAPPHSKGPGPKTYVLTLYALSGQPKIDVPASAVNREVLLSAMEGLILDTAELKVVYTRSGDAPAAQERPPRP